MTPADELRAAATKLREMTKHAGDGSLWKPGRIFLKLKSEYLADGYWWEVVDSTGTVALCAEQDDDIDDTAEARAAWIALMGPDKAEPLAAWLDAEAACQDAISDDMESQTLARVLDAIAGRETGVELATSYDVGPLALAFARAVLGEKP